MKYGVIGAVVFTAAVALMSGDGLAEGTLKPGAMARVNVPAVAKRALSIYVKGNGNGDIDCYLYHDKEPGEPFGKFITCDISNNDSCDFRVVPDQDETYLLLVQNASNHDERYVVSTH